MINRVEGESKKILGSGNDDCLSCAEPFGILFFGQQPIFCFVCNKKFCNKCCTDFTATRMHRMKYHESETAGTKSKEDNRRICRVCCEKRELWKRSGAWFYNGLPPFISIKCNGQEQSNFNSNPIIDLPDHNVYGHHPTGSFLSLSSSSEFSESETSSSSRHTHTHMMYYDADSGSTSNISAKCETHDSAQYKKGKFGYIVFSLLYDEEKCVLQVKVIKARKLKAKDMIGSSDPYVKVHLIPGNKQSTKQRTKTVRRNVNPTFNETLIYSGIPKRDVQRKRILLTVKDHDRIGSDDFLGEVEVPLNQLESGRPKYFDLELGRRKPLTLVENEEDAKERGRALISLSYDHMQQVLEVRVPICTGLVSSRRRNHINAQVQAVLSVIGDQHFPKQTTTAKSERRKSNKAASNLVFAECLRLYLPTASGNDLSRCNLDIAVWDRDGFGRDSLIGAVHFSVNAKKEQLNQWVNCAEVTGTTQEGWHHLIMVEDASLISLLHENRK